MRERLCDEYNLALAHMLSAEADVGRAFTTGRGSSRDELDRYERAYATWEAIEARMDELLAKDTATRGAT